MYAPRFYLQLLLTINNVISMDFVIKLVIAIPTQRNT